MSFLATIKLFMFTQAAVNQHIIYDILILYFIAIRLTRSLFKDYLLTFVIKFGIKPKNHLHMDSEACRVLDDLERYKYIFVIFSSDTIRYLEK